MKAICEGLVHSQLVDGEDQEKQESVLSDVSAEYGITTDSDFNGLEPDFFIFDECCEESNGFNSSSESSDFRTCGQEDGHKNQSDNSASSSLITSCSSPSKNMNMSSTCSLDLADKDELQLELDAIETHYQQCLRDLVKMREEAIEDVKRRWITRKKISVI
uniref:Uncharacterized protein n=2 Tax=Lotus japonicus TaxID=34305 RepID=I3T601_LOTJA|nr:unknown [Lotus japonicus]